MKWYLHGKRKSNIMLARLRNRCSNLRYDLQNNFLCDSPKCPNSDLNVPEDCQHYILNCPFYANQRTDMLAVINAANINYSLDILLFGDINLTYEQNIVIVESVHDYITQTNRFT